MDNGRGGVYVANVSFESATSTADIKLTLGLNQNFLLVVAAGNDTSNLTISARYPPSYGGVGDSVSDHVITVGALTPIGWPAYFSNYSTSHVDLYAPGCQLESFVPGGQKARFDGTSFSAPLVSFTAGMLASEIKDFSNLGANWIKWRIVASVDIYNTLISSAVSSGVLNVPKALAIYQDVVSEGDDRRFLKRVRFGKIVAPLREIKLCDYDDGRRPLSSYWKISPNSSWNGANGHRELQYILKDSDDGRPRPDKESCDLPGSDLEFVDDVDGDIHIPWAHILEILPAIFPQ
jgi:hypothetical protein